MIGAILELARAHAALLALVVPAFGAALAVALPSARLSWMAAALVALVGAALAADFAWRAFLGAGAPLAHEALPLRLDGVGVWAAALIACVGALVMIAAGAQLTRDFAPRVAPFAMALLMVMIAGWCGAALARDFVGLVIGVETAWLASVGLVALSGDRDRGALTGALRMLTAGGVAGVLLLLGAGLTIYAIGAADLAVLADAPIALPGLAATGLGLILSSLALKAGVAPLHLWVGGAYGRIGGVGSMALGTVGAVGALAILVRVAAFAMAAPAVAAGLSTALLTLGLVSVVVGSVQAVGASNARRLAAYAGAAQAGCVLVSAALGSPAGFAAAMVQLIALSVSALALLGGTIRLEEAHSLAALDGLSRRAPLSSVAVTAGALSLMGAPLTLGFLGRWRLIEAGVGGGWWWAASAVIVVSLAAVFYSGRLIERIYFRRANAPAEAADAWRAALAPTLVAAIAAIALGLEPSLLLRAADAASAMLTGASP